VPTENQFWHDLSWGDVVVLRIQSIQTALACCCLLAATAGCQIHRTGHGFILQGHWSLELNTANPADRCGENQRTANAGDARSDGSAESKPEILAWHARPKNHRLAAKLFHRDNADEGQKKYPDEGVTTDCKQLESPKPIANPPEMPASDPAPAAKPAAAKLDVAPMPDAVAPPSNSKRPDLASD
jgi:hypothetical protein